MRDTRNKQPGSQYISIPVRIYHDMVYYCVKSNQLQITWVFKLEHSFDSIRRPNLKLQTFPTREQVVVYSCDVQPCPVTCISTEIIDFVNQNTWQLETPMITTRSCPSLDSLLGSTLIGSEWLRWLDKRFDELASTCLQEECMNQFSLKFDKTWCDNTHQFSSVIRVFRCTLWWVVEQPCSKLLHRRVAPQQHKGFVANSVM